MARTPEEIKAYNKAWRERNKDKLQAYNRSPERMAMQAARARAFHWSHREQCLQDMKARYEATKDERYIKYRAKLEADPLLYEAYLTYMRNYAASHAKEASKRAVAWKRSNPDKVKLNNGKRKAAKNGNRIGLVEFAMIVERSGGNCGICHQPLGDGGYELDHIIPLIPRPGYPAGTHTEDNLQLAHPRCNRSKKNKHPEEL